MDPLYQGVLAAVERLAGVAHRTPVLTSRSLDEVTGNTVFLKCENFQRMGAFKFRGAYNAISRLSPAAAARGVITYSSGNHAQAVALAGRLLGVKTTVVMPADAPAVKLAATRKYGAEVVTYDRATMNREDLAAKLIAEHGYELITTDARGDLNKQISDVEDMLSQGINYLILNPQDPEAGMRITKIAKSKNVPVVVLDDGSRHVDLEPERAYARAVIAVRA